MRVNVRVFLGDGRKKIMKRKHNQGADEHRQMTGVNFFDFPKHFKNQEYEKSPKRRKKMESHKDVQYFPRTKEIGLQNPVDLAINDRKQGKDTYSSNEVLLIIQSREKKIREEYDKIMHEKLLELFYKYSNNLVELRKEDIEKRDFSYVS